MRTSVRLLTATAWTNPRESGAYAMSAPAFDEKRNELRYTDGNSGFYNVRLTNGVWPKGK